MPKHDIDSLVKASRKGDLKQIEKLLACNVDVNARNKENKYALIEALNYDRLEAVRMLLDAGANSIYALRCASREGNKEMIDTLIKAGADVNMNMHGLTPLLGAVCHGHLEVVKLLLDHGADINAKTSGSAWGNALPAAMDPERIDIARLLLKRGADVNVEGGCYGNVLQTAIYFNNIEMVKTLLFDERVDVYAETGSKGNAWDVAYEQKNYRVIEMLEESLNEMTSDEETSEDSSREDISEEESSDKTMSDKKSLRENTKGEESLNKKII